jgi:hypothetical protein
MSAATNNAHPHRSRRRKPLPRWEIFARHIAIAGALSGGLISGALTIGALGYHGFESLPWVDAYLNASMILTGMGPVDVVKTEGGKIFAIFYSLFSGVVFLTAAAVLFAPVARRFLHRFHLDFEDTDESSSQAFADSALDKK